MCEAIDFNSFYKYIVRAHLLGHTVNPKGNYISLVTPRGGGCGGCCGGCCNGGCCNGWGVQLDIGSGRWIEMMMKSTFLLYTKGWVFVLFCVFPTTRWGPLTTISGFIPSYTRL